MPLSKNKKPRRNPWRKIKLDDKTELTKSKVDNKNTLESSEILKDEDKVYKKSKNINESNKQTNISNNSIDKVDILINGSGINSPKEFLDIDLANWDDVIRLVTEDIRNELLK